MTVEQAESNVTELQRAAEENLAVCMPSEVMKWMKINFICCWRLENVNLLV